MINSIELQNSIDRYKNECEQRNKAPTFHGLASVIGVCTQTICNVNNGCYASGKPYTSKPSVKRCIDNNDFELITGLFTK